MSAPPPPNLDTRELPYGWIQQYNWDYRQWFYVNTREQPPRSSWEHPLGPSFAPPPGPPPPDRGYNRSPYGGPPPPPPGYSGYGAGYGQPPQGYYSNAPPGGYASGSAQPQVVYEQPSRKKKGPGMGTAILAGGAGLVGGALLMDAIEDHNQYERDQGFDTGYQDGFDNGQMDNNWGGDGGFF